jgi:hypothetical protein
MSHVLAIGISPRSLSGAWMCIFAAVFIRRLDLYFRRGRYLALDFEPVIMLNELILFGPVFLTVYFVRLKYI